MKTTHPVFGTKDVSRATFKPLASCSKERNHFTPMMLLVIIRDKVNEWGIFQRLFTPGPPLKVQ